MWGRAATHRVNEEPRAVVAHTPQHSYNFGEEPHVKHGPGQLNVAKVPGTGGHVTSTGLAALPSLNDTLTRVHET